jgi:hypothetical protein
MESTPQRYTSVHAFFSEHRLLKPRPRDDWRLTERVKGAIQGIPSSFGFLTATNGIDCFIERDMLPPFHGHVAWFVTEKGEKVEVTKNEIKIKTTKTLKEYTI